jgi:3-oxoacyl-[acyl-carrier protein] reductase
MSLLSTTIFKNKNILVTGVSSGIGLDYSERISKLGGNIFGISRSPGEAVNLLDNSQGQKHYAFPMDFAEPEQLNFSVLDGQIYEAIFLSAGIDIIRPFQKIKKKQLDDLININLLSHLTLLQHLLKQKAIANNASIIFMSSINGTTIGSKGHVMYATVKAAINGLTKSLANELSPKGIRVNAIAAGLVKTNMFKENMALLGEDEMKNYESNYPLGLGECEDITSFAIYLSSSASRWITGQTHVLDGGLSIKG